MPDEVVFGCYICTDEEVLHLKIPTCGRCKSDKNEVEPFHSLELRTQEMEKWSANEIGPFPYQHLINTLIICKECDSIRSCWKEVVCDLCRVRETRAPHAFAEAGQCGCFTSNIIGGPCCRFSVGHKGSCGPTKWQPTEDKGENTLVDLEEMEEVLERKKVAHKARADKVITALELIQKEDKTQP
jgi:hypothetical protein